MKNKNILFKTFLAAFFTVFIVTVSFFVFSGCLSSDIPEITLAAETGEAKILQNTISVSGTGTVKVLPDEAFIDISVITERASTQEAVDENSTISQNVINVVKQINAQNQKIQTIYYELSPLYDYSKNNQTPELYAYRVTSTIEVRTTDLKKVGEIISKATEAGASSISSLGFDLTQGTRKTAKNNALASATVDANDKALAIATSMGLKIDSILYISEEGTVFPGPLMAPAGLGELRAEEVAAPSILPQEIEVTSTINIVYQFSK